MEYAKANAVMCATQPDQNTRESQLQETINRAESAARILNENISLLEDRLRPVLMAPKPQDESNTARVRHSAAAIAHIDDVGDILVGAYRRLNDLVERLVT